jgi:precorrin-3B synthase
MNALVPKGWCPSLFAPMSAGDGWLARIKPPRATLTVTAAARLAQAAAEYGNGTITATNRGNLQARGLSAESIAAFAAAIVAAGLADPDPAIERRRAVIFPPLADERTVALATAIDDILSRDPHLARLPAKFAVAINAGGPLPLGETGADLTVICAGPTCHILPHQSPVAAEMPYASAAEAVRRLALAFLELAERCTPPARRMRDVVVAMGAASLLAAVGLDAIVPATLRSPPCAIGWLPYGAFGIGVPFGIITASMLQSVANLATQFGDGTLRVTPWRALILPGIAAQNSPSLRNAAEQLGLIVDAGDPRRAIFACTGRPGCASSSVDLHEDAEQLLGLDLPGPVHLSGCAKGCAHPGVAAVTLVGEEGRYGIVRNGRAGDEASPSGLTMAEVVAVLRAER